MASDPSSLSDFGKRYLLSVMAAGVAETVTFPLDLTKTRMQIQGELVGGSKTGLVGTAVGIFRQEGVLALWRGVSPGVTRHIIYTGIRISVYDRLRQHISNLNDGHKSHKQLQLHHRIVCGMTSGAIAQFIASPTDLIKVRMQTEGQKLLRQQGGHSIRPKTMIATFREVLNGGGGILGLWKGCVPNVQRAALVNLGDLTGYDQAKRMVTTGSLKMDPESRLTHALSSIASGLVAATMGTPADVVKTRVMNQPLDQRGRGTRYRGSLDCLFKTVKSEGVTALYKGFIPIWLRMAPWSMTFWLTFEQLRILSGLKTW